MRGQVCKETVKPKRINGRHAPGATEDRVCGVIGQLLRTEGVLDESGGGYCQRIRVSEDERFDGNKRKVVTSRWVKCQVGKFKIRCALCRQDGEFAEDALVGSDRGDVLEPGMQ